MVTQTKKSKNLVVWLVVLLVLAVGVGVGTTQFLSWQQSEVSKDDAEAEPQPKHYSVLTGMEIAKAELNNSPTFCVQIPNGSTDGARPQAGLSDAAVVFEAIAEGGITRFAAIYQNPTVGVIGPIRSLRPYYLEWDTPFDCTVVHAGGSDEALTEIAWGGQRNLDESTVYMWREDTSTGRLWNNLFTSPKLLLEFNQAKGYNTSAPAAFAHLTPEQTTARAAQNARCGGAETESAQSGAAEKTQRNGAEDDDAAGDNAKDDDGVVGDTEDVCAAELAQEINVNFSWNYTHNVQYKYDVKTNTYLRYHLDGQAHMNYVCPEGAKNTKTECGALVQVAPSVVVVMRVYETLMADNYHESIQTVGSGVAEIFQNGEVIHGSWSKSAEDKQIIFRDEAGEVLDLATGQLWIMAVPQSGAVTYD